MDADFFKREHQITIPTSEDVSKRVRGRIQHLAETESFMGRRPSKQIVMNAILHWFGNLSDEELSEFVVPKLREFAILIQASSEE